MEQSWELLYSVKSRQAGTMTVLRVSPDNTWLIEIAERLPQDKYHMRFIEEQKWSADHLKHVPIRPALNLR